METGGLQVPVAVKVMIGAQRARGVSVGMRLASCWLAERIFA